MYKCTFKIKLKCFVVVVVELTESDSVEHAGVGRSTNALVDDANAILHGTLTDIVVQIHDEEGDEEAVDQVLGEPHQNTHPVSGQVP